MFYFPGSIFGQIQYPDVGHRKSRRLLSIIIKRTRDQDYSLMDPIAYNYNLI